jgi:hypothetical protein
MPRYLRTSPTIDISVENMTVKRLDFSVGQHALRPAAPLIPLVRRHDDGQKGAANTGTVGTCTDDATYRRAGLERFGGCSMPVLGVVLLLESLLVGCANAPVLRSSAVLPAAVLEMPQRYLIVTLPNPVNLLPGHVASTPRGYDIMDLYRVDGASRRASRAIAESYRLREVSSWPIAVLGVNCVVYELPADVDLERLLATLACDARIKSAQALSEFVAESR